MAVYRAKPLSPILREGHPAARGSRVLLPLADAGSAKIRDAASLVSRTPAGTTRVGGPWGPALRFNGTPAGDRLDIAGVAAAPGWTWAARVLLRSLGDFSMIASAEDGAGQLFELRWNVGRNLDVIWGYPTTGQGQATDPATFPLNTWAVVASTWDGATVRLYRDAMLVASAPATPAPTRGDFTIGQRPGSGFNAAMDLDWFGQWGRVLSPDELRRLQFDPHEPTRPRSLVVQEAAASLPLAGSAVAFSATAGPASLSLPHGAVLPATFASTLAGASLALASNPSRPFTFSGTAGPATLVLPHGAVNPSSFSGTAGPASLALAATAGAVTSAAHVPFLAKPPSVLPRRGHPMMAGKRTWMPMVGAVVPPRDAVGGRAGILANSGGSGVNPPTIVAGPWGPALLFDATSQQVQFPGGGFQAAPPQCTFHAVWRPDTTSTTPRLILSNTAGKLSVQHQAVNGLQLVLNSATAVSSGFGVPTNGNWLGLVVAADLVGKTASFWQYDYATGVLQSSLGVTFTATMTDGADDTLAINSDVTHSVRGAISDLGLGVGLWTTGRVLAYFRDPAAALRVPSMAPSLAASLPPPKPVPFYHLFMSSYCGDI